MREAAGRAGVALWQPSTFDQFNEFTNKTVIIAFNIFLNTIKTLITNFMVKIYQNIFEVPFYFKK